MHHTCITHAGAHPRQTAREISRLQHLLEALDARLTHIPQLEAALQGAHDKGPQEQRQQQQQQQQEEAGAVSGNQSGSSVNNATSTSSTANPAQYVQQTQTGGPTMTSEPAPSQPSVATMPWLIPLLAEFRRYGKGRVQEGGAADGTWARACMGLACTGLGQPTIG
jgi:hypothetical protein